jgi:hypothetical protein
LQAAPLQPNGEELAMGEVIDMPNEVDDPAAYARRLILARCPEIGLADLRALVAGSGNTLPVAIAAEILDVIELMEARLAALEFARGQIAEPAGL